MKECKIMCLHIILYSEQMGSYPPKDGYDLLVVYAEAYETDRYTRDDFRNRAIVT